MLYPQIHSRSTKKQFVFIPQQILKQWCLPLIRGTNWNRSPQSFFYNHDSRYELSLVYALVCVFVHLWTLLTWAKKKAVYSSSRRHHNKRHLPRCVHPSWVLLFRLDPGHYSSCCLGNEDDPRPRWLFRCSFLFVVLRSVCQGNTIPGLIKRFQFRGSHECFGAYCDGLIFISFRLCPFQSYTEGLNFTCRWILPS